MKFCDNCGTQTHDQAKFCSDCGHPFSDATQAATPTPAGGSTPPPGIPVSPPGGNAPSGASTAGTESPQIVQPPAAGSSVNPARAPQSPDLLETKKLSDLLYERYVITRKLGEGGMGRVYLAEDSNLYGKQCVVKEMLPYYTSEEEKAEAERFFLREVKLLASLRHPGIPQISDHFIIGDHYYYVMEFVEGETLAERAARLGGRLPEREALEYLKQIADVLAYIASRPEPVVHRDIKPDNLIIDQVTGQVKLVDFGLAKAKLGVQTVGQKSSVMGTPGYAPPEQYQGQTEARSDVYALGATMHHMLSGQDPRNAPMPFQFAPLRSLVAGISPQAESLVAGMLEFNVAGRPTAAQLKQAVESGSLIHRTPPPTDPSRMAAGLPLTFRSGAISNTVDELIQNCENFWDDGAYHLYRGDLASWLQAQGRGDLAQICQTIRQRVAERDVGLEQFLQSARPSIGLPVLGLGATSLDFGVVDKENRQSIELEIRNDGRGYLYGSIRSLVDWLRVRPNRVGCRAGGKQIIHIDMDPRGLNVGPLSAAALEIQTNGGNANLLAQLEITWPPKLAVSPMSFNLGEILLEERGRQLHAEITIRNAGGGVLQGEVQSDDAWLMIPGGAQFSLSSGQSHVVQVIADSAALPAYQSVAGALTVRSTAGEVQVAAKTGIKKAQYDLGPRLLRWGGYLLLMLLAGVGLVYPLALLADWAFGYLTPVSVLPYSLMRSTNELAFDLLDLVDLSVSGSELAAALSVIFVVLLMLSSVIPARFSRLFIRGLDEIEGYHSGRLLAQMPVWDVDRRLATWVQVGVGGVAFAMGMFGTGLFYAFETWQRLLISVLLGFALSLSVLTLHWRYSILKAIIVAAGMVFLGSFLSGGARHAALVTWGLFGLFLSADLTAQMPKRWRWLLVHSRPILLIAWLTLLAVGGGQLITDQYVIPFFLGYGWLPDADFVVAMKYLFWLACGIGGAYLGLRMLRPLGAAQRGVVRVFWVQYIVSLLAGLAVFTIVRLPFLPVRESWQHALILFFVLVASGGLAGLALWRKEVVEQGLLLFVKTINAPVTRFKFPKIVDRWRGRFGGWLAGFLGQAPLDGLIPLTAFSAAGLAVITIPYLAYLFGSSLQVLFCILGILIPLAVVGAVVYFVIRQAKL